MSEKTFNRWINTMNWPKRVKENHKQSKETKIQTNHVWISRQTRCLPEGATETKTSQRYGFLKQGWEKLGYVPCFCTVLVFSHLYFTMNMNCQIFLKTILSRNSVVKEENNLYFTQKLNQ